MRMRASFTVLNIALVLMVVPEPTLALESELVVVTSFRKEQSNAFIHGFEKKFPGVKVEVLNKQTPAGIKYIQETAGDDTADLFWAFAPDAFEVLKGDGLLQKYTPKEQGIPEKIGAYPVNDPDGYYSGFAAAGYGIMYNGEYLKAKGLPEPKEWVDLSAPVHHGHVGMSAPSRSGTTHLAVETVLQGEGWTKGWALWKQIGGNLKTVTQKSFGVPEGIDKGDFGVGVVIDFFGLSSRANGFPVDFVYPTMTALVPTSVALVKNARHPDAAKAFIEYLLSREGQRNLLRRNTLRLPVNPQSYVDAPSDFPNPFTHPIGAGVKFDVNLSRQRYDMVDSLFDIMITNRIEALREATKSIQEAQTALKKKPNAEAAKLVNEARKLVADTPVTADQARDPAVASLLTKKLTRAKFEEEWGAFVERNYAAATVKAKKALSLIREM